MTGSAIASRLDEFAPVWQFHEVHRRAIAAPPERVFDAVRNVTADEILFFRTLTAIRRGFRSCPESILNPTKGVPILDVATRTGFTRLAEEPPRELVIGMVLIPPRRAVAAMNFLVQPDGKGGSLVSTETRIHASDPAARRRFGAYWRVIYPGSALIRRMWLRAIDRRATAR